MSDLAIRGGRVLTPAGWVDADLRVDGRHVAALGPGPAAAVELDATGASVLPGFVDLHVHAAGGGWPQRDPGELATMARALVRGGVTSFLLTTVAAPLAELRRVLDTGADTEAARCVGVHLEGPWLAAARAGAQPAAHLRPIEAAEVRALAVPPVRLVTLAPELPGALPVITELAARGIVVAMGHSDATYDESAAGAAAGARHVTHAFNAMRGLHHRDPGLAGAALDLADLTVEVIADGVHVHPAAVRLLWRARGADAVCLVSDGVDGCGTGGELVREGSALRRADGRLAGSTLTLVDAVRNAVAWGIPLADAARMAAATPARVLGRADLGSLHPGALADAVVLDGDLQVRHVVVGGRLVHSADAA